MHIALVSPLFESTPPRLYGGTERTVASLSRGLVELGHEVTLFASGDSEARGELAAGIDAALRLSATKILEPGAYHLAQLAAISRRVQEFDVIHNHMDYYGFPLALNREAAVISTLHGRLDHPDTLHALTAYPEMPLVSISDAQRLPVPDLNWYGTVHHGLEMDHFALSPEPGKYLAFLGRISPEKRPDLAIAIAHMAGVPLKIAAKVDAADRDYYEAMIKPLIDGRHIEYIGEISEAEKSGFLGGALGLVFPIDWPEPFGLAPVEAWACGTPVLARPCGSVPELHRHGVTGFVDPDPVVLAALVPALATIDRRACRRYAEQHFSYLRMAANYIEVYQKFLAARDGDRSRLALMPKLEHLSRRRIMNGYGGNRQPSGGGELEL